MTGAVSAMNGSLRKVLVVVFVLAAGAIGFGAYRWLAPPKSSPVALTAPPPAPLSDLSTDKPDAVERSRGLPEKRPVFALKDRDGKLRSITEWDGKSLVINFWATWCAPCRREIPMLRTLHAARARDNIEVIGVAVDFRERVLEYAKEIGLDYPLLIGEQDGLDALDQFGVGVGGFPMTVFTDNQGRIVTAHLGELHAAEADAILDAVVAINAGKLSLDAARQRISAELERIDAATAKSKVGE